MFYDRLHEELQQLVEKNQLLDKEITIRTHILKPAEAIGDPERKDFPLLKGKEVLMQATFLGSRGQAYTDAPSEFSGPLREILDLGLEDSRQKALFIAALNAVMRYLYPDIRTVHCKNNEPEECSQEIKRFVRTLSPGSVGLIGLQPAMLDAIVRLLGAERVACIDRDEDNRNQIRYGVPIGWGDDKGLQKVFEVSDVVLATGSSSSNGSLEDILTMSAKYNKQVYFYGVTIAGAARLMGLNHLCFKST
jgi:uncharacterized protein (DUF4213/DUF364 family)